MNFQFNYFQCKFSSSLQALKLRRFETLPSDRLNGVEWRATGVDKNQYKWPNLHHIETPAKLVVKFVHNINEASAAAQTISLSLKSVIKLLKIGLCEANKVNRWFLTKLTYD